MQATKFLDQLAAQILSNPTNDLTDLVVILPNKRAKVFLIDALKKQANGTIFAPEISSVEELIQEIAQLRSIDNIELLFDFYDVYLSIAKTNAQNFEMFANWAKTLLQDFNEIDRYLLDPNYVLTYLKDIDDIKKWGIEVDQATKMLENYIDFWKLLPTYYHSLKEFLLQKKVGYQGLIYRIAVDNLVDFAKANSQKKFIFAGFNALNDAEEKIIQYLIENHDAEIFWDIDQTFLNDPYHDAGLFIRRFKANWKTYRKNPFNWISNDFAQAKNIQIIGTPKSIGQAKIVGEILTKYSDNINNTAVILGDENLLLPVLYSLPKEIDALNITMGYAGKNNPVQILIAQLFKLHTNAIKRSGESYVFYYKDLLDVLTNPFVESFAQTTDLVQTIKRNNFTFITLKKLLEIQGESNAYFELLFQKWNMGVMPVLEQIQAILIFIKNNLNRESKDEKISLAFVYSIYKIINKLITYYSDRSEINQLETLYTIYKQIIEFAEVSFEGEPLNGLQIMGILESRVLDFENVIITSMNEGKFPAGKSQNSFIPYDVKREIGLPTYKEKDAIYAFHFYHVLQRAKNVYLLYNTESEGLDGGEKSRFLTQIEIEKQPNHIVTQDIYSAEIPAIAVQPIVIDKSLMVQNRLKEIAQKGFSPSSLTNYLRNPLQFYFQRILSIREVDEVEEDVAANTLGTIIHGTLENLYKPLLGKFLTVTDVKNCFSQIDAEVTQQFKEVYKEGEISKGRNLLTFEVAKRNVYNFLKLEIQLLENGDAVKVLALEHEISRTLSNHKLPFPVLIKGNVDRIEERNGKIRIIDYKTGKVEKPNVTLKDWELLCKDEKMDKIIQLLTYAFMYENQANGKPIEVGIISFKNLKNGFLNLTIPEDTSMDREAIENYENQISNLIAEILNPEIPFTEKI